MDPWLSFVKKYIHSNTVCYEIILRLYDRIKHILLYSISLRVSMVFPKEHHDFLVLCHMSKFENPCRGQLGRKCIGLNQSI